MGTFLPDNQEKVVSTAEIFGYDKTVGKVEIGYRVNENFWRQGVATKIISALVEYLFDEIGINCIQDSVMPENVYSGKALLKSGFVKEGRIRRGEYWEGKGIEGLDIYFLLKSEYQC